MRGNGGRFQALPGVGLELENSVGAVFGRLVRKPAPNRIGPKSEVVLFGQSGLGKTSRLPISLRVVLESVLRNCDGKRITEDAVRQIAAWKPNEPRTAEVPFVLARIMLQDMAGFPALNDFAAMRAEAQRQLR